MSDFVNNLINVAKESNSKGINKFLSGVRLIRLNDPDNPDNLYSATFDCAVPVAKTTIADQVKTEANINNTNEELLQYVLLQALELCPNLWVPERSLKKYTEEMTAIIHRIVTIDPIYKPYFYTREEFDRLVAQNPRGTHTKMMVRLTFLVKLRNVWSAKNLSSTKRPTFFVSGKTHEVIRPNGFIEMGKIIEQTTRPW